MSSILEVTAREDLYGASRAALAIASELSKDGFNPHLCTPEDGALQAEWRTFGPTFTAPVGGGRSVLGRLTRGWALRPLIEWARSQQICLVSAVTLSAAPAVVRVARALGVPSVLHLRSTYLGKVRYSAYARYGADQVTAVIAASQAILEEYRQTALAPPGQRVSAILDGVPAIDALSREEARSRLGLDPVGKYLGVVGTISAAKGVMDAAELAQALEGFELVVLGEGHGEYADRLRAMPKVRSLGFRADAAQVVRAFDIFVHPSRAEGLGLAPVEALAAGVPVVASNVGGLPEALGDGAVLLPPDDRSAWIAACRKILDDTEYMKGLIARGLARAAKMSAVVAAEHTGAEYRRVIG